MKIRRRRATTIIVDASFCPDHHFYGWAFYITFDDTKNEIYEYGADYPCATSNEAELIAANKAIDYIIEHELVYNRSIMLATDCDAVLTKLDRDKLRMQGATNINFRHIHGHLPKQRLKNNKALQIQHWCDITSRSSMRRLRNKFFDLNREIDGIERRVFALMPNHKDYPSYEELIRLEFLKQELGLLLHEEEYNDETSKRN